MSAATITALFTGATSLVVAVTALVRLLQHERQPASQAHAPEQATPSQVVR